MIQYKLNSKTQHHNATNIWINILTPDYQIEKKIRITQDSPITIGGSQYDSIEIFNETVAPGHVTISLIDGDVILTSDIDQTFFNPKTNELFIGLVRIVIRDLQQNDTYNPLDLNLFKIISHPITLIHQFTYLLGLFSALICLNMFTAEFIINEPSEVIVNSYLSKFIYPKLWLAIFYFFILLGEYKTLAVAKKNILFALILKIAESLSYYIIFCIFLFQASFYSEFLQENYYLIEYLAFSFFIIKILLFIKFEIKNKKISLFILFQSLGPLILTSFYFWNQLNLPLYITEPNPPINIEKTQEIEENVKSIIENFHVKP